jgi:hypothetical protein
VAGDTISILQQELSLIMSHHPAVTTLPHGTLSLPWKHILGVVIALSKKIRPEMSIDVLWLSQQWNCSEHITDTLDRLFSLCSNQEEPLMSSDSLLSILLPLGILSEFPWIADRHVFFSHILLVELITLQLAG